MLIYLIDVSLRICRFVVPRSTQDLSEVNIIFHAFRFQREAFRVATAKHTANLKLFKEIFWLDNPKLIDFIKEEVDVR